MEPITRAWSRSLRMSVLRSVNPECSDSTRPSCTGTAAHMSGPPRAESVT